MLRTTPLQPLIALDRNKATRAKPSKGEEVVGKKKFAAEPLRILTQSSLNKRTSNTLGLMM
jgi:hypothetical protein